MCIRDRISGEPGFYVVRIRELIRQTGINLVEEYLPRGADGVSRIGEIAVRPGLASAEEFSVLVHEAAHEIMHSRERRKETTKLVRETEAEAVAFVVSRAIGLETSTASSDYIQLYDGSRETLQDSLREIRSCAVFILDGLLTEDQPADNNPADSVRNDQ